jgi:hypothetical protein
MNKYDLLGMLGLATNGDQGGIGQLAQEREDIDELRRTRPAARSPQGAGPQVGAGWSFYLMDTGVV